MEHFSDEDRVSLLGDGASADIAERLYFIAELLLDLLEVVLSGQLGLGDLRPFEFPRRYLVLLPSVLLLSFGLLILLCGLGRWLLADGDGEVFIVFSSILGLYLGNWGQFSEFSIEDFEYFMEIEAYLGRVGDFLFHFACQFIEKRSFVLCLLGIIGLLGYFVVDDLVVILHLVDHFAVDGRQGCSGQLLIFTQIEILEVSFYDDGEILLLQVLGVGVPR